MKPITLQRGTPRTHRYRSTRVRRSRIRCSAARDVRKGGHAPIHLCGGGINSRVCSICASQRAQSHKHRLGVRWRTLGGVFADSANGPVEADWRFNQILGDARGSRELFRHRYGWGRLIQSGDSSAIRSLDWRRRLPRARSSFESGFKTRDAEVEAARDESGCNRAGANGSRRVSRFRAGGGMRSRR